MINKLQEKIKNNLIEMDNMLDLMWIYEDEDLDNLYEKYEKLFNETQALHEKLNQIA